MGTRSSIGFPQPLSYESNNGHKGYPGHQQEQRADRPQCLGQSTGTDALGFCPAGENRQTGERRQDTAEGALKAR